MTFGTVAVGNSPFLIVEGAPEKDALMTMVRNSFLERERNET